jgi:hypothetical protein
MALERAANLSTALSSLLSQVAANFQREVQTNIEGQGSEYGKWREGSKWFFAKKGLSRMFEGQENNVRVRNAPGRSEVVFQSPGDWTLTLHQHGFTEPPSGAIVDLDLKMPGILGIARSKFSFVSLRASTVPPRRMWPEDSQATRTATPLVEQWAKKMQAELTT